MREFKSAAKRADSDTEVEFKINGEVLTAVMPGTGQLTYFMATQASGEAPDIAKAMLELLAAVLGPDDWAWFESCIKTDEIDAEMIGEVVEYLSEEWSERPTTSVSDSSQSQAATTKRSTAKPRSKAKQASSTSR